MWKARQLSSGRAIVEKKHGGLVARIYQGEGYWTANIIGPHGELMRTSATTIGTTKMKASRALRALSTRGR